MAGSAEWNRVWTGQRRQRAIEYLGGRCVRCGATESLEFDHVDRATRLFTISRNLNRRWETLQAELNKCQLLCHDCHRIKTVECGEAGGGQNKLTAIPHGTHSGYTYWKCRCDDCRTARRAYRQAWSERTGKPL